MIRYQLRCDSDHNFEIWFKNAAAYDEQLAAGELACPLCGSDKVVKAIMAPNVSPRTKAKGAMTGNASEASSPPPAGTPAPGGAKAMPVAESFAMHRELTEAMRKIRREVEANAEYVGPRFADEARKIHEEESEPRGIYGEATADEVRELVEDGIDFVPLPRLPEDNN